jgi:hypothetical protein
MQTHSTPSFGERKLISRVSVGCNKLKKNIDDLYSVSYSMAPNWTGNNDTQVRPEAHDSFCHISLISPTKTSSIDAGIKIRPDAEDLKTMPEFEDRWKAYFENSPDKAVMGMGPMRA